MLFLFSGVLEFVQVVQTWPITFRLVKFSSFFDGLLIETEKITKASSQFNPWSELTFHSFNVLNLQRCMREKRKKKTKPRENKRY